MNNFLLIFFLLTACGQKFLVPDSGSLSHKASGPVSRNRPHLFPNGIYSHRITITDSHEKNREFRGYLRLSENEIYAVGLSKMGTTFFRLNENLVSKKVTFKFYYPVPNKFKKRFVDIYFSMKNIFLMPMPGLSSHCVDQKAGIEVNMDQYDKNGIPMILAIKYKNFSVLVTLDEYQIGSN